MGVKADKIIIDEEREAKRLLENPEPFFSFRSLMILAKYYYSLGLQPKDVKKEIQKYLSHIEFYNNEFYEKNIDKLIKKSRLFSLKRADIKVAITKKEIAILKKLSHRNYKIALYMLFLGKVEKYQHIKKGEKRARNFKTFLNYNVQSCAYNIGINLTNNQAMKLGHELYLAGVIEPTYVEDGIVLVCANDDNKNIEFVIDGKEDFLSQIKYYCTKCGNMTEKFKRHDYCAECYKEDLRIRKLKTIKKIRSRVAR